jgi:hypothetical protein
MVMGSLAGQAPGIFDMLNVQRAMGPFINRNEVEAIGVSGTAEANPPEISHFGNRALFPESNALQWRAEGVAPPSLDFHEDDQASSPGNQVYIVPTQAMPMSFNIETAGNEIGHRFPLAGEAADLSSVFPFLGRDEFPGAHGKQAMQHSGIVITRNMQRTPKETPCTWGDGGVLIAKTRKGENAKNVHPAWSWCQHVIDG